jgi:hypothetical protein
MPALWKHQQCYQSSSGHPLAVDGHLPHVVQPLLQHKNVWFLVLVHFTPAYVKHPSYVLSPESRVPGTQNVLPRCESNMVPVVDLSLFKQNPQFVFFHHDGTAILLPAILAPFIVVALVVALVVAALIAAVVSVSALVCVAVCLQFCITTPTYSLLTNPLFHSL